LRSGKLLPIKAIIFNSLWEFKAGLSVSGRYCASLEYVDVWPLPSESLTLVHNEAGGSAQVLDFHRDFHWRPMKEI
jgi:hypothetical protein